ncbi:hypothetical protein PSK87_02465 [Escherichia coli]|nr:hypothetical protein [Escherichia coli]
MTRVWPTDNPDANGEMNWSAYNGTLYGSYYITVSVQPEPSGQNLTN